MSTAIKIVARHYDKKTGYLLEEIEIRDDDVIKAGSLKELGYLHMEQIDIMSKCQDFRVLHQIKLTNNTKECPICGAGTQKHGKYNSEFHSIFSDHKVEIQRLKCKGGCNLPYKLEGIFGTSTHPDLLKKQAALTAEKSYVKASKELNYDAENNRVINNRTNLSRVSNLVSKTIESIQTEDRKVADSGAKELICTIDGGHIKKRGEGRSFEAMIATVYKPESIKKVDKNHQKIIDKRIIASSKNDSQQNIKKQFLNACIEQGMGKDTQLICLADGAENCWSVAELAKKESKAVLEILDWFHIGKKFKNTESAVTSDNTEKLAGAKWHLWHGNSQKAINKLELLIKDSKEIKSSNKLKILKQYIENNQDKIINYDGREAQGLVYTSSYAESTVSNLINVRQKNKQRMTWTRDGANQVLQIRALKLSNKWDSDWEKIEERIYLKAA